MQNYCRKYLEHLELLEQFRRRKRKMKQKKHSESVESLCHIMQSHCELNLGSFFWNLIGEVRN